MNTTFDINTTGRALMSLQKSCENTWISNATAWRLRRKGWLTDLIWTELDYVLPATRTTSA
jgi:hypothetical protein